MEKTSGNFQMEYSKWRIPRWMSVLAMAQTDTFTIVSIHHCVKQNQGKIRETLRQSAVAENVSRETS